MQKTTHWPSVLVLGVIVPGALLFLLAALGFGIASIVELFRGNADPAGVMIASISTGFEGILLVLLAWFVFQKTRGDARADEVFRLPFQWWHILVMVGIGAVALTIGVVVVILEIQILAWLFLPALTLLLIVPPIWVLLGVGTHQLDFGPRWRAFGIFGLGMTIGPLIMIFLEMALLVVFVVILAIILSQEPGKLAELTQLGLALQNETDPDTLLQILAPYIFDPRVVPLIFGYIALAVPMIEEIFKPFGVWLFANKIETPSQGFALGLLSGAAYALVESLGASGQGDTAWPVVVAVRAGTSLLHITPTGLMGWAIVGVFRQKKFWQLLLTYITVVLIHGIWNGSAAAAGLAATSIALPELAWSFSIIPAALCGLMVLLIGMVAVLLATNRRARKLMVVPEVPAAPVETEKDPPASENSEANAEGVQ